MTQINHADVACANAYSAPSFIVIPAFKGKYIQEGEEKFRRFTTSEIKNLKENPEMISQDLFNKGFGKEIWNNDYHLFMIDYDSKNDPSLKERLFEDFYSDFENKLKEKCLQKFGKNLDFKENWHKIVFETSKSGGLHFYFTCKDFSNKDVKDFAFDASGQAFIELKKDRLCTVPVSTQKSPFLCKNPSEYDKMEFYGDKTIDNISELPQPFVEAIFEVLQSYNEYVEAKKVAEPQQKKVISTQRNEFSNSLPPWKDFLDRESNIDKFCEITGYIHKAGLIYEDLDHLNQKKTNGQRNHSGKWYRDHVVYYDKLAIQIGKGENVYHAFKRVKCENDNKIAYLKLLEMGYGVPYTIDKKYEKKAEKMRSITPLTDEQIHGLVNEYWEEGRDGEAFMLVKYYDFTVKYSELLKENGFYRYGNGFWASTSGLALKEDARKILKSMFTIALNLELISIEKRKELELEKITNEEDRIDKAREFDKIKRNTEKTYQYRIELLGSYSFQLGIFQGKPQILVPQKEHFTTFDYNKTLINFQNGTLNIGDETTKKEFYPHKMADMLTYKLDYDYDPKNTDCLHFMNFLQTVFLGDQELIDYVQMSIGYLLTGRMDAHIFFIWWGEGGRNGKSMFAYILKMLLGHDSGEDCSLVKTLDKACISQVNSNKNDNAISSEMFKIGNSRAILVNEFDKKDKLNVQMLKSMSTGEPCKVRKLFCNPVSIDRYGKFIIISNHLPQSDELNNSFYDRIRIIPFNHFFEEKDRIDEDVLLKRFSKERSAIFNWALQGYSKIIEKGFNHFKSLKPQAMLEAINAYKENNDPLQTFINEYLVKGEANDKISNTEIFAEYTMYVNEKSDKTSELFDGDFKNEYPSQRKLIQGLQQVMPNAMRKSTGNKIFLFGYKKRF
jgi:P4 family phage/plasmid primase-like protien